MKNILYVILLVSMSSYSQKKQKTTFLFENETIEYFSYSYAKRNVLDFYVIYHDDADKLKKIIDDIKICFANRNQSTKFYFLLIPKKINSLKTKEKLFLEFVSDIVNRSKLIDSNLFIISNEDYSNFYKATKEQKNNKYKYGTLNDIKDSYIENNLDICKIIN